jgi:hypothetical protein
MLTKPSGWAPYKNGLGRGLQMGAMSSQDTQMLGVAVLSAISIAGIHSAICPSYFTMKTFASQPEAKQRSMEGLWISLGVSAVTSASLYFVFKSWMPVIFAGATSLLLFGIGVAATNSEPPKNIPPIEKQNLTPPTAVSESSIPNTANV